MLVEKKLVCTNCKYVVELMTDITTVAGIHQIIPKKCPQCKQKTLKEKK